MTRLTAHATRPAERNRRICPRRFTSASPPTLRDVGGHHAHPGGYAERFPDALGELVRHAKRVGDIEVPAPLPVGIASAPTREVSATAAK